MCGASFLRPPARRLTVQFRNGASSCDAQWRVPANTALLG